MDVLELDERTLESVAAYDASARAYQAAYRLKRPVADVRRFGAFVERGALVLDAGCGPANDLRLLRDVGAHPVGVDLSLGALREARMLLPRHPLVRASIHDLPLKPKVFGGLWLSGAFDHLPRAQWRPVFDRLMTFLDAGPVYLSCVRGNRDLAEDDDPVLGRVYRSSAHESEVEALFEAHDLDDIQVELRPDPIHDRKRPLVVALGHR